MQYINKFDTHTLYTQIHCRASILKPHHIGRFLPHISWAEAAVVSDANPGMFARWVTRRFRVKDKRKSHSTGPVGPSQTDPSQSGQCHQQELHGRTAKHCHFHIHTLTRIQKDWECWWMYVRTAFCTVIIYWTDMVLQGATAGKVLTEECVRQDWETEKLRVCV